MGNSWKCKLCGWVFTGEEAPETCPICGAKKQDFILENHINTLPFQQNTDETFIVLGGGIAGLEAVKAVRERNKTAHIKLVCKEETLPYNRPALSDVLARGYDFKNILLENLSFYEQNNIETICGLCARMIDTETNEVILSDGSMHKYDKLCIAIGAVPFNMVRPRDGAIPVFVLRTIDDALKIMDQVHSSENKDKHVVISGGGILGLEAAVALVELGVRVTVLERSTRILPNQTDEKTSIRLRTALEAYGVKILTEQTISMVYDEGVILSKGSYIRADFVLSSTGSRSETLIAEEAKLDVNMGILVNEHMQSSNPRIYAAGDCAEFQKKVAGQWAAAALQGQIAGAAMAGDESKCYLPPVPFTVFEVGNFSLFSAGAINGRGLKAVSSAENDTYRCLTFRDDRLAGAIFYGGKYNSGRIITAIENQIDIESALPLLYEAI